MVTVRELLDAAHEVGMVGMPYLAIYAASLAYAQAHPEQALYDEGGQALTFEGFLGIMDPTADSMWAAHLLAQCDEILAALPFDGHHVDQYGEPKIAYNASAEAVDLPAAFVDFMAALKRAHPHKTAVFNAVGNWPIDALATGAQETSLYRNLAAGDGLSGCMGHRSGSAAQIGWQTGGDCPVFGRGTRGE